MIYTYFIHYRMNCNKTEGLGTTTIELNGKIKSINTIRDIEEELKKENNADSLIMINYILLNKRIGIFKKKKEDDAA